MRRIILTASAACALIAAPAFAQSAGNLGGLLGGGGANSSSASNTNSSTNRVTSGLAARQGATTIGGISADPQFSYSNSNGSSRANSSGSGNSSGMTQTASNATHSGSFALPLSQSGARLGGNSFSSNHSLGRTTNSSSHNGSTNTH